MTDHYDINRHDGKGSIMNTNGYTSKKAKALAKRLAEEQADHERRMAKIAAEHQEEEKKIERALKTCGPARVALVEDLLERFGIKSTALKPRVNKRTGEPLVDKDGNPRMEDVDKDERLRMQRLFEAIEEAIDSGPEDVPDVSVGASTDAADDHQVGVTASTTARYSSTSSSPAWA